VALVDEFYPFRDDLGVRGARPGARLLFCGLRPEQSFAIALAGFAKRDTTIEIRSGHQAWRARAGPEPSTVSLTATADRYGHGSLVFDGKWAFRVVRVDVRLADRSLPGWWLLGQYAILGLFSAVLLFDSRRRVAWLTAELAVLGLTLAFARLHFHAYLPWLIALLAAVVFTRSSAGLVRRVPAMEPRAAWWIAVALTTRLAFVLCPSFAGVDLTFHAHNIARFRGGALITSVAPGLETPTPVPYPPALYAIAGPPAELLPVAAERVLATLCALLEGFAPLVVFAIGRRLGMADRAAAMSAATMALMPEGVLVLAKGIAANVLGSFATLLFVYAVVARWSPIGVAAATALLLLSHFGVVLTVVPFMFVWAVIRWRRGELSNRGVIAFAAAIVAAAGVAWLVYYREVIPLVVGATSRVVTAASSARSDPVGAIQMNWVRLGKITQDVILKFGFVPVVFAVLGRRDVGRSPALKSLLQAMALVGLALGVAAVLTPVTLRFEYFLVPAVALAAGLGAARLSLEDGRQRWLAIGWAVCWMMQLAIVVAYLNGRFEIISVIVDSDRWPFPFAI